MDTVEIVEEGQLTTAQIAYRLGYRPCCGCSEWDTPQRMIQAIDAETGEPCWFCNVCMDRMPHTAEVVRL